MTPARDKRLKNLLQRQANLGRNHLGSKVVGIHVILAQLIVDPHLVKQPGGICFRWHVFESGFLRRFYFG
jgi:hypothetical protein